MLENATRICAANFGNLLLCEGEVCRWVAMHNAPQAMINAHQRNQIVHRRSAPVLDRVARTKEAIHIIDLAAEYPSEPILKLASARTLLLVPMLKESELIGAIGIYRQEVLPFTDKQIELVKNFAAQAVIAIENTRLLSELRESLRQQTATADVLKVISRSAFNLQTVLDTLVESAARLCHSDSASIHRPQDEAHPCIASYGLSPEFQQYLRDHPIARGRGSVLGRVVSEGKIIHVPDVLADAEHALVEQRKLGGYRTVLGVPLRRESEVIGLIRLTRNKVQPFTDKQIELVTTFADQAVIAIENARLFDEVRARTRDLTESLEQQTATSEVLKVISSSRGELEPVFDAMLANATRICEAKFGTLYLLNGDDLRAVATTQDAPRAYVEARKQRGVSPDGPVHRAATTKQVVHIADIKELQSYLDGHPGTVASVELGKFRTVLGVPMLRDDELIGVITINRQEVRSFTDKQIGLVKNFAAQAVIAIENTRLLTELRESLQQQTATADVLKAIASSTGALAPVFSAMLGNAAKLCEASYGALWLREDDGFRTAALHGDLPQAYIDQWRSGTLFRPRPEVLVARVAAAGQTLQVPDLSVDESYLRGDPLSVAAVEIASIRTLLGVPMIKGKELVGAIVIYRKEIKPFADKQIELVKNFAAQAVIAIENTRLLSELRESLQQQTATADVLKVISRSTFDLRTVLQTLVESAARLCDADKGNITREKNGVFYRAAESYGFSPEFLDHIKDVPLRPDRGNATGRALLEGRVIHIPDVKADPEYTLLEAQRLGDYRTILAVPMLREGVALGVLTLSRSEARPFTDKQIELVTTFADQAAIAIENVRLFESVEARTRELAKSLEDLRATQDRLVQTQKLASLGQLTAGIAHEIKNPLNFVNNFSGLSAELIDELQDTLKGISLNDKARAEIKELTDTLRGNLDKVVQHGKRADAIVKNMLLHSREGSSEHRVIDTNAIVEESLNLAYHGARAEKRGFNITLERSFDPAAGEIDAFPQDITRALLNLISNGFYAASKRNVEGNSHEPTLTAATKNLGDRVEITIRDNGTGISPEVKEKMFNPFFTTKPAGEGTGLGLSISYDIIVKQHGGSIEIDTQPGEFTEIRVILPRVVALLPERS